MNPETFALIRTNRAAQLGLAAAVLLVLIGTAKVVDMHSSKPVVTPRDKGTLTDVVKPAQALALDGPLMPHYAKPQPPPSAPTAPDQPQAPQAVVAEAQAAIAERELPAPVREPLPQLPAPRFAPVAPEPAVAPAPPPIPAAPPTVAAAPIAAPAPIAPTSPAPRSSAAYCPRCGEVVGLTVWPDVTEVHVRFQDGSTHAMRTGVPARWRVGDRVRAEGGRLVAD